MNIGAIGYGYVGLVSAAGFAELGHNVIAAESDAARSKLRQKGQSPFHEPHLPQLLRKQAGARLLTRFSHATTARRDYLNPWHTGHRKGARNGEHPVNR